MSEHSDNQEKKYRKPKVTLLQRLTALVIAILVIVVLYHFYTIK
ncbi:hypothetical protein PsalN5692_01701 [Piscirickettsia salmonis]|nr:hypothetical protein [Piscirickettsia salmonis]QGP50239.1 hypothetical protein PsalN5692_01701 [Piscirickettsia salmonis]QGP54707.1 hypothetical protein PsalSR1_02148 [Piscirickettsia salmonis]QGP59396.1 hypothetical protein PsalBI1_01984 [Piscirickettsia salmonis]QGP64096.1 hypothetical protein PsalMR5_01961 [Piscirickettsia salmonis]